MHPKTMFEKIRDDHLVAQEPDEPAIIYIDQHLVHEVTSAQAFDGLREAGRKVRRLDLTVATADHNTPTWDPSLPVTAEISKKHLDAPDRNSPQPGRGAGGGGAAWRGEPPTCGPWLRGRVAVLPPRI